MAAKKVKADAKESKLTPKQRLFVQYYCGNATDAARKAGYKGNEGTIRSVAAENLAKPNIQAAIQARQEIESRPTIMSRQELQDFWSEVTKSAESDMKDRLKASELLGKSEAMFTDNLRVDATVALKKLSDEELDAKLAALISGL